jgi:hypothetical protein
MGDQWNRNPPNEAVTKPRVGESITFGDDLEDLRLQSRKITSAHLELAKLHPPYPQELIKALILRATFRSIDPQHPISALMTI